MLCFIFSFLICVYFILKCIQNFTILKIGKELEKKNAFIYKQLWEILAIKTFVVGGVYNNMNSLTWKIYHTTDTHKYTNSNEITIFVVE